MTAKMKAAIFVEKNRIVLDDKVFKQLAADGLLDIDDAEMAAAHFNWLVMAQPLNQAMLLGDGAIPNPAELRRTVKEGLRVFIAAYGVK